MPDVLLCQGTALALPLKDASVHCVVCSPPYWQLRDYGTAVWQGGDPACLHTVSHWDGPKQTQGAQSGHAARADRLTRVQCRCGAARVDQQIGLEPTIEAYVAALVQVFREVRRVLHPMGTLWCNMGTTYQDGQDLGIPWRLAFALKDDGWRLRSEIIYAKMNPMPESVQTRPTRAHEQVFLFSKQAHYHYDAMAVREPGSTNSHGGGHAHPARYSIQSGRLDAGSTMMCAQPAGDAGRNMRSVLSLPSEPSGFQHFACMPTALVRRCLLAGAPTAVCAVCRAPHRRIVERSGEWRAQHERVGKHDGTIYRINPGGGIAGINTTRHTVDHGQEPTCTCAAGTQPCTILDPFCGSGTTLLVARELGHHAVGVDLSYPYLHTIARERLGLADLARWQGHAAPPPAEDYTALPLFGGG